MNTILILLSERMGDVIFCTPAIALLKAVYPKAQIHALTVSQVAAQVLDNNPAIHKTWVNPRYHESEVFKLRYDAIIDLHDNKVTKRWRALFPEIPTYINPRRGEVHQSEVATQFMASILEGHSQNLDKSYQLFPGVHHYDEIAQHWQAQALDMKSTILIGCHMGSHTTTRREWWKFWKPLTGEKCWSIASFGELMTRIVVREPRVRFVLTGVPTEAILAKQLKRYFPDAIDLIGKTSVLSLAALMQSFRVFLTGDTGPMHVAVAMKTPMVGLFGPTNSAHTGPYPLQAHHQLIQAETLEHISVEEVEQALLRFL